MSSSSNTTHLGSLGIGAGGVVAVIVAIVMVMSSSRDGESDPILDGDSESAERERMRVQREASPLRFQPEHARIIDWWDGIPEDIRTISTETGPISNIHPDDYAGPESCRNCHKKNYETWAVHPHRWMNAMATEENVVGDFSGEASISHLGGKADFYREDGSYRMRTERDSNVREYVITQTIGSRFFQYYIGKQIKGDHPEHAPTYDRDQALPFGYWIEPGEWVPVVHVYPKDNLPDGERTDAFGVTFPESFPDYASSCNHCHTTFPAGDQLVRILGVVSRHAPMPMHFAVADYFSETHPELWDGSKHTSEVDQQGFLDLINRIEKYEAPIHGVSQGVSCEACHLGCKEHVENPKVMPSFFPHSPHLLVENGHRKIRTGRNHTNVNWTCGRCHTGGRPQYSAGMSTWNSTEYTDSTRGSCYSQLKCVDCHNPHKPIGSKWSLTPAQDDAKCLKCHEQYQPEDERVAHTHHPINTPGSRCMNCHMPRLNEGLQDVVRTHMITVPTDSRMIENNEPNACNMCHTEKPIDWTLAKLQAWYAASYREAKLRNNYPDRKGPTAIGWLKSSKPPVRLVAADCLTRTKSTWAMNDIVGALDDAYLINRQFARVGLEQMTGITLADFGYLFYMTPEERREPVQKIRKHLTEKTARLPATQPAFSETVAIRGPRLRVKRVPAQN